MASPLMVAAGQGQLSVVQALVQGVPDDGSIQVFINQRYEGKTALVYAARSGHAEVVRYLLGVEGVFHHSKDHESPLFAAIDGGHLDIVKCLVSHHKALLDDYEAHGVEFIDNNDDVLYGFSYDYYLAGGVYRAAHSGCPGVMEYLLRESRKITVPYKTPLMLACTRGHDLVVREILSLPEGKRDMDERDEQGETALHRAVKSKSPGRNSLIRALLRAGADTTIKDTEGRTAIEAAQDYPEARHVMQVGGWKLNLKILKWAVTLDCDLSN